MIEPVILFKTFYHYFLILTQLMTIHELICIKDMPYSHPASSLRVAPIYYEFLVGNPFDYPRVHAPKKAHFCFISMSHVWTQTRGRCSCIYAGSTAVPTRVRIIEWPTCLLCYLLVNNSESPDKLSKSVNNGKKLHGV